MSRESEAVLHEAAQIRALAEELERDAEKFDKRISELRRGGLPSSSMGGSSRGAETPLPLPDKVDQFLLQQRRTYRSGVQEGLRAMQKAVQAKRSVVEAMDPDRARILAEDTPGEYRFECSWCREIFKRTDTCRPKAGRCPPCYEYWRTHDHEDNPHRKPERAAS